MIRNTGCIFLFLTVAILLIFCGSFAEIYDDPAMCFSLTQDGWIRDIVNAFEIRASDTNLYEFDAFTALTLSGEVDKADYDISSDPRKPYDGIQIFFDSRSFKPADRDTENQIKVIVGAIIDPETTDSGKYEQYVSMKNSVIDGNQRMRRDILVWANTFGDQIPAEGIFWLIQLPDKYSKEDIGKYGSLLNYLTRFVNETKQSGLDFRTLLSSFETDETGCFLLRSTRQLTGKGYSIGLIADPAFVFLTAADSDAVLFRNSESVIQYMDRVCEITEICGRQ